jgi:hypothetical protein
MPDPQIVVQMDKAVTERLFPAITRWNRLEGRPRAHNFDRALKAEVRDALWMLTKQWQMGEFLGDDAGSPVLARAAIDTMAIDRFQAGQGPVETLSLAEPLEARVERRPLPLRSGSQYLSLDLRLVVGRRWLKMLERDAAQAGGLSNDYRDSYCSQYKVNMPDPGNPADAAVCAHPETWQQASAVASGHLAAGQVMDGIALLEHIAGGGNAYDGISAAGPDEPRLTNLAGRLLAWFNDLILQPQASESDAWLPRQLEYQFGVSAQDGAPVQNPDGSTSGHELVMRAAEYYQGHLDWYALERSPQDVILGEPAQQLKNLFLQINTFIPVGINFPGMPNTRWWAFEDQRTNFGEVKPDTTDLGKLLLMEFALVFANDWFVLPYTLPVGQVAEVKGIAISNVFNERIWVEPLRDVPEQDWQQWSMFNLSAPIVERQTPPARLVLLPTVPKLQESTPLESVTLIRDEMANMVWGVEQRILLPSGLSRSGLEAAREYFNFLQKPYQDQVKLLQDRETQLEAIPESERTQAEKDELAQIIDQLSNMLPPDPVAQIRYKVMNTVPENWIPFIPVHVDRSTRETQLQRAALPRMLAGDPNPPQKIRPRTNLLRANLPKAYFIHEEEVPRAGAVVEQSYQRTRWVGGKVFTWLGVRKSTGRGEGASGLAFDQIAPVEKAS